MPDEFSGKNRNMNILFIASDNDRASGAFLSMVRLCSILKNTYKHNVYVLVQRPGDGQILLEEQGIPVYYKRAYNWIARIKEFDGLKNRVERNIKRVLNKKSVYEYIKLIKELEIEIVHINTSWTYIGAVAAKRVGVPYVWHIREFLEEDQNVRMWNRNYGYRLISDAEKVITISDSIYQKYKKLVKKEKLVTIYNGIDADTFYSQTHGILDKKEYLFLIIGFISEPKGQWQLIEAASILRKKGYSNFKIKIVGKGQDSYVENLRNKVHKLELEAYIEFCGYRSDAADLYKKADITFVCSKAEAFGRVTVEAMMGGSLVIGADIAATRELIDDHKTGLLYKSEDPNDLAQKIEWTLNHMNEAKEMADRGRNYMFQNMTAEKNAEKINEVYLKIGSKR